MSCGGMKPGGASAGNKLYETFFVGEEGSQYFIKPLEFKNDQKEKVVMDFTLRYKDDIKDSALVNFTIISPDNIKSIDQVLLESGTASSKSKKVDLLFVKRESDGFHCRFTFKSPLTEITELYGNNEWKITTTSGSASKIFYPTSKSRKSIEALNYNVFQIFK
jgi:hypothetical protein